MPNQQCENCHKTFPVTTNDLDFYDRISPEFNRKKYKIPAPTHCPDCRLQRRLAFRNERNLYKRKCDLCNINIISQYEPNSEFTVYCNNCWWSDKWDRSQYAMEYDFNKRFFEQYHALLKAVPKTNLVNQDPTLENSDYVNYVTHAKNCYLVFAANWLENCMYSSYIWETKDTLDCSYSTNLELCYQCMDCDRLFNCWYLQQSRDCNDCILGYGLKNCTNCIGCINLINKQYCIFNKQLSKEEYQKKLKLIQEDEKYFNKLKHEFIDFSLKHPRKFAHQINCDNSSGEGLKNCHNCYACFDGYDGENLKWLMNFPGKTRDCYDISGCADIELCYECHCCGLPAYRVHFSDYNITGAQNFLYCTSLDNCKDCFGCVGLRKSQYCILNKEYSEQEYNKLAAKIIEQMQDNKEWGEFPPINLSPFPYNISYAPEYFSLKKEEVINKGWQWHEPEKKSVDKHLPVCECCNKNFNIIPQEKEFYKQRKIFTPKKCPDCRHQERITSRNSRSLWKRQCMCTQPDHSHEGRCNNEFETTYSPDRKEIVYCGDCYKKEIY